MPKTKTSSKPETSTSKKKSSGRFIPNVVQLQEAIQELPDPETWNDDKHTVLITADQRQRKLEFTRIRIARGSTRPYRWIFEGKILIRNQDIGDREY